MVSVKSDLDYRPTTFNAKQRRIFHNLYKFWIRPCSMHKVIGPILLVALKAVFLPSKNKSTTPIYNISKVNTESFIQQFYDAITKALLVLRVTNAQCCRRAISARFSFQFKDLYVRFLLMESILETCRDDLNCRSINSKHDHLIILSEKFRCQVPQPDTVRGSYSSMEE
jgi:hypothetical protein